VGYYLAPFHGWDLDFVTRDELNSCLKKMVERNSRAKQTYGRETKYVAKRAFHFYLA
jgi:hypothetical protein